MNFLIGGISTFRAKPTSATDYSICDRRVFPCSASTRAASDRSVSRTSLAVLRQQRRARRQGVTS
jgi:hypothetical protein